MGEYISIGLICTLVGAVIGLLTFARNKSKDEKSAGRQDGVIVSELAYIKANTDEIKAEQREQRKTNTEVFSRLSAVEASAKQAHLRMDRFEGREYPGHNGHE